MSGNFLTAIHIMTYLAYPANAKAPAAHIMSFLLYIDRERPLITSDEIAGVLSNNPVVIRRLVRQLRQAGLVTSTRGKTGGYLLARPADAISLLDIFMAVEGETVDFFALANRDNRPGCSHIATSIQQTLHPIFTESVLALKETLGRYSVAEVLTNSLARLEASQKQ